MVKNEGVRGMSLGKNEPGGHTLSLVAPQTSDYLFWSVASGA